MSHTPAPLDSSALTRALLVPSGGFARVEVVDELGSSNVELAKGAAAQPEQWPSPSVLIANSQIAGKGRLDRVWEVPAGSAMISSVFLRPDAANFAATGYGWLSILAGVALCQGIRAETGIEARLKWPNDVVVGGRKLAGILAQVVPPRTTDDGGSSSPGVVVGAGANISQQRSELPVERATSLTLELGEAGTAVDRNVLLPAYLNRFARLFHDFASVGGDATRPLGDGPSLHRLASDFMTTLGVSVRAELPGGVMLHGTAESMGTGGELEVRDANGKLHTVSAGDVLHLRRVGDGGELGYA